MLDRHLDGESTAKQMFDELGGKLRQMYWMFGTWHGMAVFDAPDNFTVMALLVSILASGDIEHCEVHPLIAAGDLAAIQRIAKSVTYHSPTDTDAPTLG